MGLDPLELVSTSRGGIVTTHDLSTDLDEIFSSFDERFTQLHTVMFEATIAFPFCYKRKNRKTAVSQRSTKHSFFF